jgi:proline iminopeptidase
MKYIKARLSWIASVLLIAFLISCSINNTKTDASYFDTDTSVVQTGGVKMIPIKTHHGVHNVWTKRIGNNPTKKVLLLSGGPGIPHDYLEVFESFFPAEGIEFYYYDEMGNGYSDKPGDSSRYTIAAAVDELEQVRQALNLEHENFYLYGHSWGGLLAMEYALKYQHHLKALIISNMCSSGKEFDRYIQHVLVKYLPPAVLDTINTLAANQDYDNPRYTELVMRHFYAQFICRLPMERWPEPMTRAMTKINAPYYLALQGPNEMMLLGSLRTWNISDHLGEITVPTLLISARYDEMDPDHIKWMSQQVPQGQFLFCPKGSHLSMYDDQQFYMKGIIRFIQDIDRTASGRLSRSIPSRPTLHANTASVNGLSHIPWGE